MRRPAGTAIASSAELGHGGAQTRREARENPVAEALAGEALVRLSERLGEAPAGLDVVQRQARCDGFRVARLRRFQDGAVLGRALLPVVLDDPGEEPTITTGAV